MVRAIRGATTVLHNEREEILEATKEMLEVIFKRNHLVKEDLISMIFTLTPDLDAVFPAVAARQMGITNVPLMCMQEVPVPGALPMCVRVMIETNSEKSLDEIEHAYLRGAVRLRPDLVKHISVAVDGPAGAGKSSVSKEVAKKMGYLYIDTGAMYRAAALYAIQNGIPIERNTLIPHLDEIDIQLNTEAERQQVLLNGEDVTEKIRTPEVSMGASAIAVIPEVRLKLVELQRKMAAKSSVIMDGRDVGTYVLPDADLKIYLTASVEERAKRRFLEMQEKGEKAELESICEDIRKRDENDMNREFAPLKQAEDAILVDSSDMGFSEVVEEIMKQIEEV